MKFLYRFSLFFLVAATFFSLGIFVIKYMSVHPNSKNELQNINLENINLDNQKADSNADYQNVNTNIDVKMNGQTTYLVKKVDLNTNEETEGLEDIPDKYIGFTREELEKEMNEYSLAPSLSDLEQGFVSASLESFSKEKVVIKKEYRTQETPAIDTYFFLVAEDNLVTVYMADKKTVYLCTNISMDSLPQEIQNEILDTKYIENEAELYNFLESYSS